MSNHNSFDRERFHQATLLFYSSLLPVALSACVSLAGISEIISGNVPQGNTTAMGGLTICIRSIRLAQSACDNLKKISQDTKK